MMSTQQHQPQMASASVEATLSSLFPTASWTAEPLDGGMTNKNFRVELHEGTRTCRTLVVQEQLPDEYAQRVGIQRDNQFQVMRDIAGLGIAPELVFYDPEARMLVVEYVEGDLFTDVPDRPSAITQVAHVLSRFHVATRGSTLEGRVSDPFAGTEWLYSQVSEANPKLADEYRWTMNTIERIRQARGRYLRTLCHSDVSEGNVLFTVDSAILIDWEYVGSGDPYYDVADFAEKARLSESEETLLISEYDGKHVPESLALIKTYRFISMLREGLWSILAGDAGFVVFDHEAYGKDCLSRMTSIACDTAFDDYIAIIANGQMEETTNA